MLALLDEEDCDLADWEERESVDGDREEFDFLNSQGEPEVVPRSVLVNIIVPEDSEPAAQDSLLLLDSDLDEPD